MRSELFNTSPYPIAPHRIAPQTQRRAPRVAYHTLRSEPATGACLKAGPWAFRLDSTPCGHKIRMWVRVRARLYAFSPPLRPSDRFAKGSAAQHMRDQGLGTQWGISGASRHKRDG